MLQRITDLYQTASYISLLENFIQRLSFIYILFSSSFEYKLYIVDESNIIDILFKSFV